MIILMAVLALVVVQALAKSPWGVFTIAMTIPVAFIMGLGLAQRKSECDLRSRFSDWSDSRSVFGADSFLSHFPAIESWFRHDEKWLAWAIMIYGLAASILPVWMLLTPRDYLSTFLKLGTVAALAVAVVLIHPTSCRCRRSRSFIDGSGLVFAGPVFPFVCITIACGAVSGFHSLIASGTTPKMLEREIAHSRHRLRRDGDRDDGGADGDDRRVRPAARSNISPSTRKELRPKSSRKSAPPVFL